MDNIDRTEVADNALALMGKNQNTALAIFSYCLLLAAGGTFLFNNSFYVTGKFWGLNVSLLSLAIIACVMLLRRKEERQLSFTAYGLIAGSLFFALTFAWRDSSVLNALSAAGIVLIINLALSLGMRKRVNNVFISESFNDLLSSFKYGVNSFPRLIRQDIQWREVQQLRGQSSYAVYRGLVITIPLLVVFALLLTASDARFEKIIYSMLNWGWKKGEIAEHIGLFIIISFIAAAILRAAVLKNGLEYQQKSPPLQSWSLGTIEVVMLLGTLNVLFFGFVAVQFSYFFGGDSLVQSSDGLTYAFYARRGFFQLVAVALLVIALLLLSHYLYRSADKGGQKIYSGLVIIMILLTMIIELSAVHRMSLYTSAYGLTELRFYTSVFMAWLVVLFIWFSVTVLRGQRAYFSFGAVISALLFIVFLHSVNPDARIASFNLARLQEGKMYDSKYLVSLSADAVPTLYAVKNSLSKYQCKKLLRQLKKHKVLRENDNWRYLNLSRYQAKKLINAEFGQACQNSIGTGS